jgi:DNA-binding NtrC family response regulator
MTNQLDGETQKHVLVVDDNLELAQAYRALFHTLGFQVTLASDGLKALEFLMDHMVDAIVCDLSMPDLEGDMFHLTVQRVHTELSRRFVFVTGHQNNPKFGNFLKDVTCPVLYKPVAADKLVAALRGVMGEP